MSVIGKPLGNIYPQDYAMKMPGFHKISQHVTLVTLIKRAGN